jgi:hypothetical protein
MPDWSWKTADYVRDMDPDGIKRQRQTSEQATQTILSLLPKLWTSGRIEVENACADLAYKERHGPGPNAKRIASG